MANVPPRVSAVIFPILREALPQTQVVSYVPEISDRSYPLLVARRSGGVAVDMELLDRCRVDIQVWHHEGMGAAEELALSARAALLQAWKQQRVIGGASIGRIVETSGPNHVRDPGDSAWRVQCSYELFIRPHGG